MSRGCGFCRVVDSMREFAGGLTLIILGVILASVSGHDFLDIVSVIMLATGASALYVAMFIGHWIDQ